MNTLNEAIELVKAGRKVDAQKLLEPLLQSEPQNISAWLWYVDTWPTDQQRIKALELCLEYNPNNPKIQQALNILRARQSPAIQTPLSVKSLPVESAHLDEKPPSHEAVMAQPVEGTKKCPFCAETIKAEAVVCRFCGRDLSTGQVPQSRVVIQPVPVEQQYQAKKRNPIITCLAAMGLLALICVCLVVLSSLLSVSATYQVTYKITGTASRASLTYANEQGGTEQGVVRIPWQGSFTARSGQFLYLSAQNEEESGSVTCEIWIDGVKWRESTSRGAYAISTCSGLAGSE